jgi:hypothetical protein
VLREASHLRKHSSRLASASEPIPCCLCRGSRAQSYFERGCALALVLGCGQHIGPGFHDFYQFALHIPRAIIPVSRGRCLIPAIASVSSLASALAMPAPLVSRECEAAVPSAPAVAPFPCEESSSSVSVAAEVIPAGYGPYVASALVVSGGVWKFLFEAGMSGFGFHEMLGGAPATMVGGRCRGVR